MSRLASVFIEQGDYIQEMSIICKEQGTISDDGDSWVDKHSGYIIKSIDFSSDEGYDDQGYKLTTKELLEKDDNYNFYHI